jgi:nitrite reductase/ring-hydroxylating ferredoxin subunit
MDGFKKVALFDEITPGSPKRVMIGENECVLFRVDEEIFGIENRCPHQLYAVFHQGVIEQHTITCPMHGWSFDLRSGKAVRGSGHLNILEVRVDSNTVWVKMPEDDEQLSFLS